MLFKVDIHDEGDTLRLLLSGEFDVNGVRVFRDALNEAGTPWKRVAVDLSDVVFMDSMGLQALILLEQQARDRGGEMTLVRPSPPVMSLLELTGLEARFAVRR